MLIYLFIVSAGHHKSFTLQNVLWGFGFKEHNKDTQHYKATFLFKLF